MIFDIIEKYFEPKADFERRTNPFPFLLLFEYYMILKDIDNAANILLLMFYDNPKINIIGDNKLVKYVVSIAVNNGIEDNILQICGQFGRYCESSSKVNAKLSEFFNWADGKNGVYQFDIYRHAFILSDSGLIVVPFSAAKKY